MNIFVALFIGVSGVWAVEHDLGDFCGTIHYSEQAVELRTSEAFYQVVSGRYRSVEDLRLEVPDGEPQCVRAWPDMNDPRTLILYDFFASN